MRSNQDWIDELTGKRCSDRQRAAMRDLSKHLFKQAYNHLIKVQNSKTALQGLASAEIADFAEDFSQDAVEKITQNNFALLEKYSQTGSFLGWATRVTTRIVATELRKPYWERRNTLSEKLEKQQYEEKDTPEDSALIEEVGNAMQDCIQKLTDRRREVFIRTVIEGEPAELLATELGTTANSIHILNYRTKDKLRKCMKQKGFGKDTLDLF